MSVLARRCLLRAAPVAALGLSMPAIIRRAHALSVSSMWVDMNGTDFSGVPNNVYKIVPWQAAPINENGLWTVSGFVPPAGHFAINWQIWLKANTNGNGWGGSNATCVAKLWKNYTTDANGIIVSGTQMKATIGGNSDNQPGTAQTGGGFSGVSNGTDYYNLALYATVDTTYGAAIDGNVAHTYMTALAFY